MFGIYYGDDSDWERPTIPPALPPSTTMLSSLALGLAVLSCVGRYLPD